MQYYSFDEYVEKKDLDEAWYDPRTWGKKPESAIDRVRSSNFGAGLNDPNSKFQQGQPPRPDTVAPPYNAATRQKSIDDMRAANFNKFGADTTPPANAAKAARVLTPQEKQVAAQQPQQQSQRVGFGRNDLRQVKDSMLGYANSVKNFFHSIREMQGVNPKFLSVATQSFKKMVSKPINQLYTKISDIDNLIAQADAAKGMREQYELLIEAIKVNPKVFQEIQRDIMNLTNAVKGWANYVATNLDKHLAQTLMQNYTRLVANKQTGLGNMLMWMEKKLDQLFRQQGYPNYQGVGPQRSKIPGRI